MKKTLLTLVLLVAVTLPAFAWCPGPWGPRPGPWGCHGGYWGGYGRAAFWTGFGLTCGAMVLGTVAAYANPPVVYASNPAYVAPAPVVYQQPAVVYQQPSPNVVYVQAPQPQTNVVYAPAPQPQTTVVSAPPAQQTTVVEQAAAPVQQIQVPATTQTPNSQSYAVRFRNPNGSVTVVPLTQSGTGWFGPQGEYYVSFPTDEQIRALYCK